MKAYTPSSTPPGTALFEFFASWKLSVVITLSGALYAVFLSIWGARSPAHVVQTISGMWPMLLFYWLLLINTACCLIHRLRPLLRGMSGSPTFLPHNHDWHRRVENLPRFSGSARSHDGGYVWIRRRFSTLGTLLLHLALFVLAIGFLLSARSHTTATLSIGQQQYIDIASTPFSATTPPGSDFDRSSLPPLALDGVDVEFWGDKLLFTRFTADLSIDGRVREIAINRPLVLSPTTFVRLTSFGYAPVYMVVAEGASTPVEEGATMLNIFPPGTRDLLRLQNFPHRVYLRFYPDWEATENGSRSRSMRLDNPRFDVEVHRGKLRIAETTLRLGESLDVEAFDFSIIGVVPTVELTFVRNRGLLIVLIGFVFAVAGMALRLPGRRGEILAVEDDDGLWSVWGKNIGEPA